MEKSDLIHSWLDHFLYIMSTSVLEFLTLEFLTLHGLHLVEEGKQNDIIRLKQSSSAPDQKAQFH